VSYRRGWFIEIVDHNLLSRVEQKSPPLIVHPRDGLPLLYRRPSRLIPGVMLRLQVKEQNHGLAGLRDQVPRFML
jgi:hypothetical protein